MGKASNMRTKFASVQFSTVQFFLASKIFFGVNDDTLTNHILTNNDDYIRFFIWGGGRYMYIYGRFMSLSAQR